MKDLSTYIDNQIKNVREQKIKSSTPALDMAKSRLRLYGHTVTDFLKQLETEFNQLNTSNFEVIDIKESLKDTEETLNSTNVFTSLEELNQDYIWDNNKLYAKNALPLLLTPLEFDYISTNRENFKKRFFVRNTKEDPEVLDRMHSAFKKAHDIRKDQSIDILYLTLGTLTWNSDNKTNRF
jgi:hypothetical protein